MVIGKEKAGTSVVRINSKNTLFDINGKTKKYWKQ
jgi:hypothetical protein